MKLTQREIDALNSPRNLNDDGTLKRTGDRPADWDKQVAKGGNGSDRG